jgi:hypothetical protein
VRVTAGKGDKQMTVNGELEGNRPALNHMLSGRRDFARVDIGGSGRYPPSRHQRTGRFFG